MNSINKDILKLAVPSILANITVPLVGMVDIAIAGHLEKTAAAVLIGGITVGSMIFDLLYWNFGFLRVGTGGLTAQAYGKGDIKASANIFSRAILISAIAGIILIALQWAVTDFVFLFIKCSPEVRTLAMRYFFIRIWAAPATLSLMAFKGWFIGMQDGISPMTSDLIINTVNIISSLALALGFNIGSADLGPLQFHGLSFKGIGYDGVAYGTVIAQYTGLLFVSAVMIFKYGKKIFGGYSMKEAVLSLFDRNSGKFFRLNADLIIRSLCFIGIYIGYTIISANYGDLMLASSSIIMKLLMIFSFFTDGFSYAGEALTGRYIGMKDKVMTKRTISHVFVWSIGVAAIFIAVYGAVGMPLLKIMTSDESVLKAAGQFLPWLPAMPLIGCAAFTWDGIYIGATASKAIRNVSVLAVIAFFAVWFTGSFLLSAYGNSVNLSQERHEALAIHILMAAYFAHLLIRTLYQSVKYKKEILINPFK
jgi:MATE family multidrug resistance protein